MRLRVLAGVLYWSLVLYFPFGQAGQAQFYDKSSNLGFALSVDNASATDLYFQISTPIGAGWGAIGSGDKMDRSLMFIIYPSSTRNDATVSVRSGRGHDTPLPQSGVDYSVQGSKIVGSSLVADIVCRNCTKWRGRTIDSSSTKQPWMWAVGPGDPVASDSQGANIDKHSKYGVFFMDMVAAQSTSSDVPQISGTSNVHVTAQPGSFGALVIIHAILLGVPFVFLFPIGIVGLRWLRSFKLHWMLQAFATCACYIGLVVAIVLSVTGFQYSDFNQAHQIIGIVVTACLGAQIAFGYFHHRNFKRVGRRTVISYFHLWTGRGLIYLGMVDTVLGFVLAGSTGGAIGAGIVSVIIAGLTEIISIWSQRKQPKQHVAINSTGSSSSNLALTTLGPSEADERQHGTQRMTKPPSYEP